jgi:hypothetical protein
MTMLLRIFIVLIVLGLSSCSKDVIGVNDGGTGRTPPPAVVIKRSSQEEYNAKRFSSTKYINSNISTEGGGVMTVSYQDTYFDDAAGNPADAVRPIVEKNLLLIGLTMQYMRPGKGGMQEFGPNTVVSFNGIELYPASKYTGGTIQSGTFRRNFAFTRSQNGTVSGAPGYEGSSEPYDKELLNFFYTVPGFSFTGADTVNDLQRTLAVDPAIAFDSGTVHIATNDAVLLLNRTIAKGSIISFQKMRGPSTAFPYIPCIVSYELLTDTNAVRIPKEELKYIIDILRMNTGAPKSFAVNYPVWVNIIESGVTDTITLNHSVTGAPFRIPVYQYFEFGRKVYFK